MDNITRVISATLLFDGLPQHQLTEIANICVAKKYDRDQSIFFEGDEADGFYLTVAGKVKIFKMSLEGKEQILHIFGPGEPFGEVPVFHGDPFPANAVTLSKAELLFFPKRQFTELVTATPSLALNMLAMLSLRLRRFATQIEHLSLKEVPGRLASYLLYLAEEQGQSRMVTLDIPKGQLASLLGTSPETLSRIFNKMTDEGLIRVEGKKIYIQNIDQLRER